MLIDRKKRTAGVLMPVASLPSRDGIGSFGASAYEFVDMLAEAGAGIWQILPLNPLSYGNSPYQPFSSFAGDELYIDLDLLAAEGLLPKKRPSVKIADKNKIDFQYVREVKTPWLRMAFEAFKKRRGKDKGYKKFIKFSWVYPYAVFITLKHANGMRCWNEWPKEQQDWSLDRKLDLEPYGDEIEYNMFLQYAFYSQWMALKKYANGKGLLIMGDMPFYVGIDSLDVWADRDSFLLDSDGRPTFIAGVPPDYFSATGQRWGNPIYNWEKFEENNFKFWVERLRYNGLLYDIVRIDHFRAFDTYWKIKASCETAIDGVWLEAPGYKLIETVNKELPKLRLIAEDLGDLRPEVLTLRDHFDLLGMYVAEFAALKEHPTVQQVAYTGTHDNQTARGWYEDLSKEDKKKLSKRISGSGNNRAAMSRRLIEYIMTSRAPIAITPVADILNMDDRARLNTPGTVGSPNWEWRLHSYAPLKKQLPWLREQIESSGRAQKK